MLIGRTGCGKTTLTQKLMNEEVKYKKTQSVTYKNKIIKFKDNTINGDSDDSSLEVEVNNISADLIELILELRRNAREEKNWALSDKIRDRLLELGIKIKDGKDKTTWTM